MSAGSEARAGGQAGSSGNRNKARVRCSWALPMTHSKPLPTRMLAASL